MKLSNDLLINMSSKRSNRFAGCCCGLGEFLIEKNN